MATDELQVAVRRRGGDVILDLTGDIDGSTGTALDDAYVAGRQVGRRAMVLNFEAVGYVNSTGIAYIVGLLAQARRDGMAVSAFGLTDHYREIFEITRLADFMTIADDEEAAVQRDA